MKVCFGFARSRRIRHRLRRAVVVVDLDEVARLEVEFRHVLRVHLDERERPAVHDEIVLLVEIGALPDMVRAPVVDQEGELVLLRLLARGLQAAPLRLHEDGLAVLGVELAVGVEPLGADDALGAARRRGSRRRPRRGLLHGLLAARALDGRTLHHHAGLLPRGRPARRAAGADRAALEADRRLLEAVRAHGRAAARR